MGGCIRLFLSLFMGVLLSSNICFADTKRLKYSMPAICNDKGKIVCGENEEAKCLVSGSQINDFNKILIPLEPCEIEPKCFVKGSNPPEVNDVIRPTCVELAQCQNDELHCSAGRIAKCFGSSEEPQGCNCPSGVPIVCEDTWQISNIDSYLH